MRADRLSYIDQATHLSLRATGQGQVVQLAWVYEHPLDHIGLKRFHENFGYGLAGRRIERSPLPFGRHRWISSTGPACDIDIADERPPSALSDWLDERSQVPVDPEVGPGWHLGVLPMADGTSAVTLVASHCLTDGLGLAQTLVEAITGSVRHFGYQPAHARTRRQAISEDAREALRGLKLAGRAVVAAVRLARKRTGENPSPRTSRRASVGSSEEIVVVPTVSVVVALDEWDRGAEKLGGNSHSLFAGFSAGLARRMERCRADGSVDLVFALSDRTLDDTRANALRFAGVNVDPVGAAASLTEARAAIRDAVATLRTNPDETFALQPLTPFVPKRAVRGMGATVFGPLPVSCSSVGELPEIGFQIDGTVAEHGYLRAVDQNVRRSEIERGGQLVLVAGRCGGNMVIGVTAYQPGATNTKPRLRELAATVLAEFGITGEVL
ncbi:hypothetical protein [Mycobacterium sp. 236(2023)]|uniref:hypothetical protein n=1 Tax=Mycobacterium sp. 236(2023) TaxID=3038163 RepID=UPI0024150F07|nr:hypothetical protein [Mycobacterium sp. 236(2023)]MDG4668995.1 hypothetical protein [Mycobacterium sp. 236(2023)]